MAEKKETKKIPLEVHIPQQFRTINAEGAVGGFNPYGMKMSFYNDLQLPGKIMRRLEVQVSMSFLAAKQLHSWLGKHLEAIEKNFGKISEPKKPRKTKKKITSTKGDARMYG
jgi:hypothetical protein